MFFKNVCYEFQKSFDGQNKLDDYHRWNREYSLHKTVGTIFSPKLLERFFFMCFDPRIAEMFVDIKTCPAGTLL